MPPRDVAIIGAELDLGAGRRGVDMGPSAIRYAGLGERISALGVEALDWGNVDAALPETVAIGSDRARFLTEIKATCERIAQRVAQAAGDGLVPLVLGGDHSIAIGTVGGMASSSGAGAAIWLDAHGDLNTPETTPSGNVHGMAMAVSLGHGDRGLTTVAGAAPKLRPGDVTMIGLRDCDPGEEAFLAEHPLRVYRMAQIDALGGFVAVVARAIAELQASGVDAVHLSFDLDVLDPSCFTATGTPVPGGLIVREALAGLRLLRESALPIRSVDWVELNPLLDTRGASTDVALRLLGELLGDW